jgi:hypothetical protein
VIIDLCWYNRRDWLSIARDYISLPLNKILVRQHECQVGRVRGVFFSALFGMIPKFAPRISIQEAHSTCWRFSRVSCGLCLLRRHALFAAELPSPRTFGDTPPNASEIAESQGFLASNKTRNVPLWTLRPCSAPAHFTVTAQWMRKTGSVTRGNGRSEVPPAADQSLRVMACFERQTSSTCSQQ